MSDAPVRIELHLGDYARDTEDLSMMEHGAYIGLMRWYYSTAKPIPNDLDRIYRRLSATSKEERHAIEHVLGEYFTLRGASWTHKRIEEELAQWRANTNTARKNARSRWEKHLQNSDGNDADAMPLQSDSNAKAKQAQCGGNARLPPSAFRLNTSKSKLQRTALEPSAKVVLKKQDLKPDWWRDDEIVSALGFQLGIKPDGKHPWSEFVAAVRAAVEQWATS